MSKYLVTVRCIRTITEETFVDVEVSADSDDEAEEKANDKIENQNYKLLLDRNPSWDLVDENYELETDQVEDLEPDSEESESEEENDDPQE